MSLTGISFNSYANTSTVTSVNLGNVSTIQDITLNFLPLTSLNTTYFRSNLRTISLQGSSSSTLDLSNATSLTSANLQSANIPTVNVSGCSSLTSFIGYYANINSLNVSGCSSLTSITLQGAAVISTKSKLETFYGTLPIMSSGTHTLNAGAARSGLGSDTSIATGRGWTVTFTG
jgi:uncharacterized protein YjbI with pentapeptide repeats